jgi:hypothetical protein
MNNEELDQLLKKTDVPKRDAGYWEEFPNQVTREIRRGAPVSETTGRRMNWKIWAGVGLATACLIGTFFLGVWKGQNQHRSNGDFDTAAARKYFHELEAMFPNRVRAVVFDERGAHLMLSDNADVPRSAGVFLKICDGQQCQKMITFSGQQIQWRGETFEVLTDQQGHVILSGEHSVFSSSRQIANSPRVESATFESL